MWDCLPSRENASKCLNSTDFHSWMEMPTHLSERGVHERRACRNRSCGTSGSRVRSRVYMFLSPIDSWLVADPVTFCSAQEWFYYFAFILVAALLRLLGIVSFHCPSIGIPYISPTPQVDGNQLSNPSLS